MAQPVNPGINALVAGEISPLLAGRTDLDWYKNACQLMRNYVSLTEGAATRRPPTKFVAEVADSSRKTVVHPFVFSAGQARVIEFGHFTVRFYANRGLILAFDTVPIVMAGPYAETELAQLYIEESADVLFIFHPNHAPAELERFADTNWVLTDMDFTDGPYLEVNADNSLLLTPSAASGTITVDAASAGATLTIPAWQVIGTPPNVTVLPLNLSGLTFSGNTVTLPSGSPAIATGRQVFLGGSMPTPLTAGTAYAWISTGALTGQLALTPADAAAGNEIVLGSGAALNMFAATDVGRFIRIGYIAPNWAKAHAYSLGDVIKNQSQGVYRCSQAGTSANVDNAGPIGTGIGVGDGTATWDFVNAGGVEYGYVRITGFVNATRVNAVVVQTLPGTTGTYYWRLGLYSRTTGYPHCGGLHQQRMFMAGCASFPDRVDASKIADYPNFTPGDNDDDPVSETLGLPTVDPIRWIMSKRVAYLGTEGSVQKVFGTTGYDSPLTPTSFEVVEQVQRGTADLKPVRIVNGLAYLHQLGRKIFELYYDFTQDLDLATELTARARHLMKDGVVDMAYQQEPYSILWCVTGAGNLIACTYYREQQVLGWHQHTLGGGGFVESICTIPGTANNEVWLVVRRRINGVTRRYVEVMDNFNGVPGDGDYVADADLNFSDCYAHYKGPPETVISGLGYLEGQVVQVLADGGTLDQQAENGLTVSGGRITLPQPASNVYVGLDYSQVSGLSPMPIAVPQPAGSSLGDLSKVAKVKLGLYRSGTFLLGPDAAHLDQQDIRTDQNAMDAGVPLFTGPYVTNFDGEPVLEANVLIRPVGPLPNTVTWIVPRLITEEA